MYEIWLMLNIGWELLKLYLWPVFALTLLWVLLMVSARDRLRTSDWRGFAAAALVVLPVAMFAVPWLTGSSITEMRYLPDWITLVGLSAGAAIVVAAFWVPGRRLACGLRGSRRALAGSTRAAT
jgi:hypothetical protein